MALANLEIEIEKAKASGVKVIKVIHGYGSNGIGGQIALRIRPLLIQLKKQNVIADYIPGPEWHLGNRKAKNLIYTCNDAAYCTDLSRNNPGITIVALKNIIRWY